MSDPIQRSDDSAGRPWWRERMMWLVVGGPGAVVLASFLTLGLALRYPDEVLDTSASPTASIRDGQASSDAGAHVPAVRARNHAATGGH